MLYSESDSDSLTPDEGGNDYGLKGVKRERADTRDYESSDDDAESLYDRGFGSDLSPNAKEFDIFTTYRNIVFQRNSTHISKISKKKFICGDLFGCDDIVGAFLVGALILCDVYSWSTDSDKNVLFFIVMAAKKQLQHRFPRDDNASDDYYYNGLSNFLHIRIAVVSVNDGWDCVDAPFIVKSYGKSDLQSYVYVVKREGVKKNGVIGPSTYRTVLNRGYKDGNPQLKDPKQSLVKPMSFKDYVISCNDWSSYGGDGERQEMVKRLTPQQYIAKFTPRQFIARFFVEMTRDQSQKASNYMDQLVSNPDLDENSIEALLSEYETLEGEFQDYIKTVVGERGKQKSLSNKKLLKTYKDNYINTNNKANNKTIHNTNNNNNINNDINNTSNGNGNGDDSLIT